MMRKRKDELDMWSLKDRKIITSLPCPFCGEKDLDFAPATGYESHFADSVFYCRNCGFEIGITLMNGTLKEVKKVMRKRAYRRLLELNREKEKHLDRISRLEDIINKYKDFNPSKRSNNGKRWSWEK